MVLFVEKLRTRLRNTALNRWLGKRQRGVTDPGSELDAKRRRTQWTCQGWTSSPDSRAKVGADQTLGDPRRCWDPRPDPLGHLT